MTETRTDVVVVGGGIAGLTAAHELVRAGVDFRLLEATQHWGGLIRTERVGGFLLDAGPDTLLAHRPEAIELCRELGLGIVPATPTRCPTHVVHQGRLHPLPEGMSLGVPARLAPLVRTSLFSWPGKLRMALEITRPRRRDGADESIASFFRRRLGVEALERIGDPLLAGIHGGDAERLSLRSTFPALRDMEARHGSLIRAMWAASRQPHRSGLGLFFTLAEGLGELVRTLVARLPQDLLKSGVRVASVFRDGDDLRVECTNGERFRTRAIVVAASLGETSRLLAMVAPAAAAALSSLRFSSSATVFLGYHRDDVAHSLAGYGLVIPRREGLLTRACTFSSSKYPGRAPQGFVLLKGYLGGLRGTETMGLDDAALVRAFEDEMRPLLGLRGQPVMARVYRWPDASPQMEVGHDALRNALEHTLAATPGVLVIGAGLRGSGVSNSVADGRRGAAAAVAVLARSLVEPVWFSERLEALRGE